MRNLQRSNRPSQKHIDERRAKRTFLLPLSQPMRFNNSTSNTMVIFHSRLHLTTLTSVLMSYITLQYSSEANINTILAKIPSTTSSGFMKQPTLATSLLCGLVDIVKIMSWRQSRGSLREKSSNGLILFWAVAWKMVHDSKFVDQRTTELAEGRNLNLLAVKSGGRRQFLFSDMAWLVALPLGSTLHTGFHLVLMADIYSQAWLWSSTCDWQFSHAG